jgi:two-component system nitrogen regulation sensor histidine kinase NtrY
LIKTIQQTIYRHGYLVITAAWLFTVSFIISNYWSYNSSPQKVQAKLQDHLVAKEQKFNAIASNTFFLNTLLGDTADNTLSQSKLFNEEFGIFIYSINDTGNPILVYWNSNRYYLEQTDIKKADGNYFVDYQNGDFELIKKTIWLKGKKAFVIGLLPIRWDYFIDNKYLTAHFDGYPDLDKQYQIITDTAAFHIHGAVRKELFKIKFREGKTFAGYDLLTIILRVIALMLLLLFINEVAQDISKEKNAKTGFLFLLLTVFALRLITYKMPVPFDFTQLELFDPSIYASDFIHPSLGDLLINVVLAYWLVHFYKQYVHQPLFEFGEKSRRYLNFIAIVLFVYTCFFIVSIIRSMVLDSKISFDVTNIFSLDIYTIVSFVILCLLVLLFFELSHIIIRPVATRQIPLTTLLIVVAVAGLTYLTLQISSPFTVANIFVLGWLLLYFVILYFRAKEISLSIIQSPFFIFWVMYFAISVAAILINENKQVELVLRKKIAENFSVQTDPVGEELLNIATQNLKDEFIAANFFRFKNERKNKFFKDSLTEANFSGYLNKYDTRIYLYDELFHPLYNDDSTKFATIRTLVLTQGKSTGIKDLYSYEATGEQLSYLFEKISKTGDKINGYMYILIKPKQYLSEAVYPELFRQSNDLTSGLNLNYAYSIYHNGKLITRFNDYNFPQQINEKKIPPSTYLQKNNQDYNELWYNAGNGKTVLIVKRGNPVITFISLFAYLFCSFLLVIVFLRIAEFVLRARFKWATIKALFNFTIRSQIHSTFIFISIFSFIVIAVATISFFIIRVNRSNEERLFRSIQIMASEIESKMRVQLNSDSVLSVKDIGLNGNFEKAIVEISEAHNVDLNLFDANGNLRISTQPYIYNKRLLSSKMEPNAFNMLHFKKETRFSQKEKIGNLSFVSIYTPIVDGNGDVHAYLNIPYLNAQAELNQEISGFLATLINLNAFIFLIAGAIAFLITNRITASFNLIGDKMKQVSLGKVNEVIEWNSNDEIGSLVSEYNKMVQKLEASAKALAQSEREGAWREMARQVAHEIKNPLTPMKLSIQYLQKAIDSGSDNVKELSQQVAKTLIEQIDQLSKIAGDFSQFANISNIKLEKFDMSDLMESLLNLYKTDHHITINWQKEEEKFPVLADKIQINRLFTNLLKNAIEASDASKNIIINIHQTKQNNKIKIAITDFGKGIPAEVQHKIFTPNFTTKTSGTGLGLAICKGIVEKANGNIWFETAATGSVFYVELPLDI